MNINEDKMVVKGNSNKNITVDMPYESNNKSVIYTDRSPLIN